jgi:cyclic pyranopterin phosphate synthase
MPREIFGPGYAFLEHDDLLTFEEIVRLASVAVDGGVTKIRLTGGEPLLRPGIDELIGRLRPLTTPGGDRLDLALTTNGIALAPLARRLREAGLDRVTVSLDTLEPATFSQISETKAPLRRVLEGIDAAAEAGLRPLKVNMVVRRGINDHEIEAMAEHFRGTGIALRYIEYMDVGSTNGWRRDEVVPSAEVLERLQRRHALQPVSGQDSQTAARWRYTDGAGEIGVISSVTAAFCGSCTRARIAADGSLYTCLFAERGTDLRALLRSGSDDDAIADALFGRWRRRTDRYSELRGTIKPGNRRRIEMSYIGG